MDDIAVLAFFRVVASSQIYPPGLPILAETGVPRKQEGSPSCFRPQS